MIKNFIKLWFLTQIAFSFCKISLSQTVRLDTVCVENICLNNICINDSISKMLFNFGKPISIQFIKSSNQENSEPPRNIYCYGDVEIIEITYPHLEGRVSGFKFQKGLLEHSGIVIDPKPFKFKNSLNLNDLTTNNMKELYPNSYKEGITNGNNTSIVLMAKNCQQDYQISSIVFEFQNDTLVSIITNFYLE